MLRLRKPDLLIVLQMSFRRLMSLIAMAFLWTGSQIPVYIFGAIPPYIYADIGGVDRYVDLGRRQCLTDCETLSPKCEEPNILS